MDNIANKFSPEPFSLAFPLDHGVDPCGIGSVEHHPHTMTAGPPGRASALQNYQDAIANQPFEDAEAPCSAAPASNCCEPECCLANKCASTECNEDPLQTTPATADIHRASRVSYAARTRPKNRGCAQTLSMIFRLAAPENPKFRRFRACQKWADRAHYRITNNL